MEVVKPTNCVHMICQNCTHSWCYVCGLAFSNPAHFSGDGICGLISCYYLHYLDQWRVSKWVRPIYFLVAVITAPIAGVLGF